MRSYLLLLGVLSTIPLIIVKPFIGVLVYSWLSYMNPHRLTWGISYDFPFALIIGVITIGAYIVSSEPKKIPFTALSMLILLYTLWVSLTTVFAILPDAAFAKWDRSIKTLVFTFLTMAMFNSRERIDALVWVMAVSLGFYGIRGGIFTGLTGGQYHVFGPPKSLIEDNNSLGAALIMTLPLMRYLHIHSKRRLVRLGLLGAMALTGLAILGSQSRGAALAGSAMLVVLWFRSRQKVLLGIGLIVAVTIGAVFMPQKYYDRLATIGEYDEDASAEGRLQTWTYAYKFALTSPIVGGGFNMFDSIETRQRFTPGERTRAAHSIWFETLGEHGFVGLAMFIAIGTAAIFGCGNIRRKTRGSAEKIWIYDLASNLQVSFIAYAVGGTFLNLAFYDLYWQLLAIVVCLTAIVRSEAAPATARTGRSDAIHVHSANPAAGRP